MVQIKSSVLVAAAAISAASALPTSTSTSGSNVDLNVILNGSGNQASPTKSISTNDFNTDDFNGSTPTAIPTQKSIVDVNVDFNRVQPLLEARRQRIKQQDEGEGDGGLKRSVKDMVKNVESKSKNDSTGGRMWKGKPSKRGPWRNGNGNDLIDLNIGHGAVDSTKDTGRPLLDGNLIDLAIRSPSHEDRHNVILTGDNHEYYRNSGHRHGHYGHSHGHSHSHEHAHLHARHHGHNRHSVVEVIGDDYYGRHGRHGDYDFIETGNRHGYRYGDDHDHVHEHIHARDPHHDGNVVVIDGDRHRHGDVTVVNNDRHRHGDTTVINNDSHRHHGDTTIVNNDSHRHHADTTVINNHKRSPKLGSLSKLAGLGRAFLKRSHSDDRHYRHGGDTTIVNNGRHGDTTIIGNGRHGDTTIIGNGRHHDTTLINNGRHGETLIVDNDRHHRHGDDTTIINNGRHHDTTVVNNGRHGDTTIVDNDGRHRHGGETTIVENHKRGHHHSDRIVVIGDERRYRDADFYYKHSWDNGLRYGKPIYFTNGDSFDRIRMIDDYSSGGRFRYGGGGNNINYIPGDAIPYRSDGRYNRVGYYGRYGKREDGEEGEEVQDKQESKRHHHDENQDITIINNENHHRHHGHDQDVTVVNNHKRNHHDNRHDWHHDRHDECKHGRCNSNHGDAVTIVNNHKRQMQDNGMGGAPGYIDVTSPVFNSTTATRIASLVLSTSNGTDANSTFVLNASSNIRTQVYLVPINQYNSTASAASTSATASNSTSSSSSPISVNLKVPIFVASSASVEPYCATFDPSPENPAPLTVTPCLAPNETMSSSSSHESQRFLYNPDTGVIHPDWQPSTDAQQLLQAIPDTVDEDSSASATMAEADIGDASITMAASASDPLPTDSSDYQAQDESTPTGSPTSILARRATGTPTSTSTSSNSIPPPMVTSGPQTSTDSTSLPQSSPNGNGNGSASNVTLIFTPVNPSIVNSASVNFDETTESDSADMDSATQQGMMSQQATMNMNKRGFVNPDINTNGNGDINGNNVQSDNQAQSQTFAPTSNDFNAQSNDNTGSDNDNTSTQAQAAPSSMSTNSGSDSTATGSKNGIHADAQANVNVAGGAVHALKGDSLLQKPMIAPESLTAPYEWRWTKAESTDDESTESKSVVV